MSHRRRLVEMRAGEQGVVFEILGGIGSKRRLEVMGVRLGVTIEKMTGSPFGGPVVVRIGQMRLAIGYGMASKVMVEVKKAGPS
jgi:ferrous iron transport protein A